MLGKLIFLGMALVFVVRLARSMVDSIAAGQSSQKKGGQTKKRGRASSLGRRSPVRPSPRVKTVEGEAVSQPATGSGAAVESQSSPVSTGARPENSVVLPWLPTDLGRTESEPPTAGSPPQGWAAPKVEPPPVPAANQDSGSKPAQKARGGAGFRRSSAGGRPQRPLDEASRARLAEVVHEALALAGSPDLSAPVQFSISSSLVRPAEDLASALIGLAGERAHGGTDRWRVFARASRLFGLGPIDPARLEPGRLADALDRLARATPGLREPLVGSLLELTGEESESPKRELMAHIRAFARKAPGP